MSKEKKQPKTYTAKQIIKALTPWTIILVMAVAATFMIFGWMARSDFDSTIANEVQRQVELLQPVKK